MYHLIALFEDVHPVILTLWAGVIMAVIGWGLLVFTWWFLYRNAEARFFFFEGFKKGGAVLENLDPSGTINFIHVEGGRDEAVVTGKKGLYVFLPRFVRHIMLNDNQSTEEKAAWEKKKHEYNELLKKRVYLAGIRKPIIHGSKAMGIAAPASVITEMEKSRIIEPETKDLWAKAFDKLKLTQLEKIRVQVEAVWMWNIDTLMEFVKYSWSEHDIKMVLDDGYTKGLSTAAKFKKMQGSSDWGWLIWPLLLGGLAVVFWYLNDSGMLKKILGG